MTTTPLKVPLCPDAVAPVETCIMIQVTDTYLQDTVVDEVLVFCWELYCLREPLHTSGADDAPQTSSGQILSVVSVAGHRYLIKCDVGASEGEHERRERGCVRDDSGDASLGHLHRPTLRRLGKKQIIRSWSQTLSLSE